MGQVHAVCFKVRFEKALSSIQSYRDFSCGQLMIQNKWHRRRLEERECK